MPKVRCEFTAETGDGTVVKYPRSITLTIVNTGRRFEALVSKALHAWVRGNCSVKVRCSDSQYDSLRYVWYYAPDASGKGYLYWDTPDFIRCP